MGALAVMTSVQSNENSAMSTVDMSSIHVYHKTVAISRELNQQRSGFCFLHGQVMDEILKGGLLLRYCFISLFFFCILVLLPLLTGASVRGTVVARWTAGQQVE